MYTDVYINTNNKLIQFIDISKNMANAIRFWRKKRGMTQQELADLLGIHRPVLSNIENPKIPIDPDEKMAIKISKILKVLVTDILRKEENKED